MADGSGVDASERKHRKGNGAEWDIYVSRRLGGQRDADTETGAEWAEKYLCDALGNGIHSAGGPDGRERSTARGAEYSADRLFNGLPAIRSGPQRCETRDAIQ